MDMLCCSDVQLWVGHRRGQLPVSTAVASGSAGVRNEGFLATHELARGVRQCGDWEAAADDKDLLPYPWNGRYQHRSLKTKAQELTELQRAGGRFDTDDTLWKKVTQLFHAVGHGSREWGVPAYDGGLFSDDASVLQCLLSRRAATPLRPAHPVSAEMNAHCAG